MSAVLQENEQGLPARPVFLTVLCILTFIGSGWYLVNGAIQVFTAEQQARAMITVQEQANRDIKKNSKDDAGAQIAGKFINSMSSMTAANIRNSGIATTLSAIFCLAGAFMMWKTKKTGFYIYIVGTLVGIISPFLIYGSSNLLSILQSVGIGFIGIVFIILYGVNLKHMR